MDHKSLWQFTFDGALGGGRKESGDDEQRRQKRGRRHSDRYPAHRQLRRCPERERGSKEIVVRFMLEMSLKMSYVIATVPQLDTATYTCYGL